MPSEQSFISLIGIQYTEVANKELRELSKKKRIYLPDKALLQKSLLLFSTWIGKKEISFPVFNILLIKNPQSFFAFIKCGKASLI